MRRAARLKISMKEVWVIQKMLTDNTDKVMKMTDLANIAAVEMGWPAIDPMQPGRKEFAKQYLIKYRDCMRQASSSAKPVAWVYFIQEGIAGAVKVGVSDCVESRLKTLQTGNPRELIIRASIGLADRAEAYRMEKSIHKLYRDFHLRGEWFKGGMLQHMSRIEKKEKWAEIEAKDRIMSKKDIKIEDDLDRELMFGGNPPL